MAKLLTPKNDYVFKRLFAQDTEILTDLINSVLRLPENLKISSVEVRNPIIEPEDITKKFIVLDIHAVDNAGGEYDIEMQVRRYDSYPVRALYYLCKMYANQLRSGEDYGNLNPVIGIHFLDYEQFPDHKDFHYSFFLRDTRYPELRLTENLAIHLFELPGIERAMLKEKADPSVEWLDFFNHAHEEEDNAMKAHYTNPMIHKAYDLLKTLSADDETRIKAETREKALINEAILMAGERKKGIEEGLKKGLEKGLKKGRKEGLEKGRKEGVEKGRKEGVEKGRKEENQKMIRKMIEEGVELSLIAKVSGLSIEDVDKLKSNFRDEAI